MDHIYSAVYIFQLFDVIPIVSFPNIKRFIMIDCQPLYKMDKLDNYNKYDKEIILIKMKEFIGKLIKNYKSIGYFLIGESENYLKFKNNNHSIIEHYYNTTFNKNIPDYLKERISMCNMLIVKGFYPDKYILDLLPEKFDLIVDNKTDYNVSKYRVKTNIFSTQDNHNILKNRINYIFVINEIYNDLSGNEKNKNSKVELIELNDYDKFLRLINDLQNI